jgi:hypothetical protein
MSFSYNAETWTPKGSNEHALDILNNINATLATLSPPIVLKPLLTNAVWIECLAVGAIRAELDQLLYQAQQSLNVATCDNAQMIHLLPIAGASLLSGTYSIVTLTVIASASGPCVIPAGSKLPYINGVSFETNTEVTLLSGATGTVLATADVLGNIEVAANQLNSFESQITNLASVTNAAAAIAGRDPETIEKARLRFEEGQIIDNNLDGFVLAVKNLKGTDDLINDCRAYYNPSNSVDLVLEGSITIPPRTAYIVVLGTSPNISREFYSRLAVETMGSESQAYTTLSDQELPFLYDYATAQTVYITIYIPAGVTLTESQETFVKDTLVAAQSSMLIGQALPSSYIDGLFKGLTDFEISDSELSLDDVTYGPRIVIDGDKYPSIVADNITIANLT